MKTQATAHQPPETQTRLIEPMKKLTDAQIVGKANALAARFYKIHGYEVPPGYRFDQAHHPQELTMWSMACEAFLELLDTDPDDAVTNLED